MIAVWIAVATVLIVTIAGVLWVRRYPFEIFAFFTCRALRKSGLQRKTRRGIVYWSGGRGSETLVLVHGVNDQAGTWAPVVPSLIDRYRLLIPDLPGHGESDPSTGPLTMQQVADGFADLLAAETGDQPVLLVGNSMGGWVALLYSLQHPDKVKKLVLEDASGMRWDISAVPLVPQNREQAALGMRLVLGPKAPLPPDYVLDAMVRRAASAPMIRLMQSGLAQYVVDNRLGDLQAPVTMIWGDGDGLLPLQYAETLKSRIANAKLHIIHDCGHIPHRQKPERFVSILREAIGV